MRGLMSGIVILLALSFTTESRAQLGYGFGQNKVQYKSFDWQIYSTEHFDVYYYNGMEESALNAARMAERGYDYLSEVLQHEIKHKTPLILYASMNDFQQTNTIGGMIGDGTRGVTESLKNRVILPLTGSYREFDHVLVHELVHAFQFDIMREYGSGGRGIRFNPPLWFVEGMAEYLSNGMDNTTRMWIRDGVLGDSLMSIEELNRTFDIRVYRIGQSVWYYIGENYGKERVGELLKAASRMGRIEAAFESVLSMDIETLTREWHKSARELVINDSLKLGHPDSLATRLTWQESYFHRLNIVPTISPDGRHIAYVTNKNLHDEIYLLSLNEDGEWEEDLLIEGGRSASFEALRIFESTMNWSRDGRYLTFVTKSGKNDALYIYDIEEMEITHEVEFEALNGLQSPSFSPDGRRVAFSGAIGGVSDLYVVDLKSDRLDRLTNDKYSVLHPQWSPDGRSIAFATDRGQGTDPERLVFGDYDLALYDFERHAIRMLTSLDGDVINPQWSADSREIAFISDHQGIPNIYRLDLSDGAISRVTDLKNGLSGITGTTPAFSWSAGSDIIVFTAFQDQAWHMYQFNMTDVSMPYVADGYISAVETEARAGQQPFTAVDSTDMNAWLPAVNDPAEFYRDIPLVDEDSIDGKEYSSRFQLDGAMLGASLGGYYGSIGGGQLVFSDIMSNQYILLGAGIRFDELLRSDIDLTYFNQGSRINYGINVYQLNNAFASFLAPSARGFVRQIYRGGNVFAAYPFSRFSRLEVSAGATIVAQEELIDEFNGVDIQRTVNDLNSFTFAQGGLAWVYDNTMYGPMGPLNGTRSRFSVRRAVNDIEFTTMTADYRRYFNFGIRSVLGWRLMAGKSIGPDAQIFRIGGPFTYRGVDTGDLIGTDFVISNLEFRYPLLPFLPPNYDFLSAFTFIDAANAWGINIPGFASETFQPFTSDNGFGLRDLKTAVGTGVRLSLGYFSLEYYWAWPTDLTGFRKPISQFSIGTFF